ncbi:MAG: PEP-CTERM sorting domain-containing protein [Akkermansiaceae bacterium]|nr:PEP-CTERM sorting domain-containing protein [Akkermansiaceae bacterium]
MLLGFIATCTSANASTLTFDTGQANNQDLSLTFGSNLNADITGANIDNGATANIGLAWAPSPDVWEVHGATSFSSIGDGKVVQMDLNGGEPDPTITFNVDAGSRLRLNSLDIGQASDQTEPDYDWTLSISEVGGGQVYSHTTAALGASDTEDVTFNFVGKEGTDYVLKFDDGGADTVRGAIDNLSFNQLDGSNLIFNPGNDLALDSGEITGWEEIDGTNWTLRSASPSPEDGSAYFFAGAGATAELSQAINVSAYGGTIDLGIQQFDFSGYISSFLSGGDTSQIIVEYQDASGNVLDSYDSGAIYAPFDVGDAWDLLTDSRSAVSGTRQIEVRLLANRFTGTNNDGYFDSLSLTTITVPEPSSTALLGLGLSTMLLRRKRSR